MNDTADRIIYVSISLLVLFGVLSFFRTPAYEKGAWFIIGAVCLVVSTCLSFKFGITNAKDAPPPGPGSTKVTDIHEASSVPPAPVVPPVK